MKKLFVEFCIWLLSFLLADYIAHVFNIKMGILLYPIVAGTIYFLIDELRAKYIKWLTIIYRYYLLSN